MFTVTFCVESVGSFIFEAKKIGRAEIEQLYLYVSAKHRKAHSQIAHREQLLKSRSETALLPEPHVLIEVLLAYIHHPKGTPLTIASLLRRSGVAVSSEQVETIFARYDLGKKKRH